MSKWFKRNNKNQATFMEWSYIVQRFSATLIPDESGCRCNFSFSVYFIQARSILGRTLTGAKLNNN